MIQSILATLREANNRGGRAVILVPEAIYEDALRALTCMYTLNAGRSAFQSDGSLVSVMTPRMSVTEVPEPFNLYLSEWGGASVQDGQGMLLWLNKATNIFTEMSSSS